MAQGRRGRRRVAGRDRQDGLAIFTATDKKVLRARRQDGGEPKWTYDGKAPFFGGVADRGRHRSTRPT